MISLTDHLFGIGRHLNVSSSISLSRSSSSFGSDLRLLSKRSLSLCSIIAFRRLILCIRIYCVEIPAYNRSQIGRHLTALNRTLGFPSVLWVGGRIRRAGGSRARS